MCVKTFFRAMAFCCGVIADFHIPHLAPSESPGGLVNMGWAIYASTDSGQAASENHTFAWEFECAYFMMSLFSPEIFQFCNTKSI